MHVCTWLQTFSLAEVNQTFKLSLTNPLEGEIHLKIVFRQRQVLTLGRVWQGDSL